MWYLNPDVHGVCVVIKGMNMDKITLREYHMRKEEIFFEECNIQV